MIKSSQFAHIGSREFPLLSLVALIVPGLATLAFIVLFWAFRDAAFLAALITCVLSLSSLLLVGIAFAFRERPRWLTFTAVGFNAAILILAAQLLKRIID